MSSMYWHMIVLALMAIPQKVNAHPVSLSWANVRITDERIFMNFKILAEDLVLFHRPDHDGNYNYPAAVLETLVEKHKSVIGAYVFVVDENGEQLKSTISIVKEAGFTGDQIGVMDLMRYEIIYQLEFRLADRYWSELTFHQQFGVTEAQIPGVTYLTISWSGNTPIEDAEISLNKPCTIRPTDTYLTKNPSDLTSSYYTVMNNGIRHELTMPVSVFNHLISQFQYNPDSLRVLTAHNFSRTNSVTINDLLVIPEISYLKTLQSTNSGLVYLDLYYPSQFPTDLDITWEDFNWQFRWFESQIATGDSLYNHTFSRFQPSFRWKQPKKLEPKN